MPTVVIFDVGNVLVDWQPELLYRDMIPDESLRAQFLGEIATKDWHFQHDAGRPFAETSAELTARHPHFAEAIAAWGPRFGEQVAPMPGMAALVDALRARGVPLYAITNFSHEFWPPFRRTYEALFEGFVDIVVSGEERLTKPDPVLYRRALDRFGVAAADALFIDDRMDNIAGAAAVGMATHLFTDAATLRAALLDFCLIDPDIASSNEEPTP
ncbi:HAD family phosphatase [Sphingomonas solaris]|uniref:HAD family phosphatase n=2 Tax=Alterirhizorhabdus solaris TaxID=2529389 RepID=A0A558QS26_9SPHN|nr:HAD family phosphatase [Sphingomonas solaris]